MKKCRKCGSSLISNGFCHDCNCYTSSDGYNTTNKFCCEICGEKFKQIDNYQSHLESHPQCPYCKERFKSREEVKYHQKEHQCPICGLYFHPIGQHLSQAHIFCENCNKWFINKESYNEHVFIHPKCEYCGKRFASKSALNIHLEYNHKCSICKGYVRDLSIHIKKDHLFCSICNKYFKDSQDYENHHSAYKISENDLEDTSLTKYKDHLYCSYCNKYFASLEKYEEKYPKCKYCGIRIEREYYSIHICQHECPLCESYHHPLEEHISKNHFYSNELDIWFSDENVYSELKQSFTEIQCDVCSENLKTIKDLIMHIRNTHSDPYESDIYQKYILKKFYFKKMPSFSPLDRIALKSIKKYGVTKGKEYAFKIAYLRSKYRF